MSKYTVVQERYNVLNEGQVATIVNATGGGGGGGGTGGAPTDAQYLTLAANSDLTSERIFSAGNGLQANDGGAGAAYTLSVKLDSNPGLSVGANGLKAVAGDGIDIGASIAVDVTDILGAGLTESSNNIVLGTPSTLTVSTSNSVSGTTHYHAITSSSNPGAAASLLATDASGYLTLVRQTLTDRLVAPLITAGTHLTLQPTNDLKIDPSSNIARVMADVRLQSDNYASQTTGWGITYAGAADFRYGYFDELHAKAFIADLEQALAGGQIISKSVAIIAADFTAPAAGGTATLWVEDLPGASNMAVFQSGDIVRLRTFSRGSGSLTIADCWGTVTNYTDGSGANDGLQSWTFTRSTGGNAGSMSAGTTVEKGSLALDYGTSGNGFYEVNAIDGAWAANSPYSQIVTWTTHPATGKSVKVRTGNLKGITAVTEYGQWLGKDSSHYIRVSDQVAMMHGIAQEWTDASDNTRGSLDPSASGSGQSLFWLGSSSGDKQLDFRADGTLYLEGDALVEGSVTTSKLLAHGVNMLDDPSFENWGTGWNLLSGYVATGASNSRTGQRRFSAEGNGNYQANATQTIPVEAGAKYYAGVWVRYVLPMSGQAGFFIDWLDYNYSHISYTNSWITVPSTYQQTYVVATAPGNAAYARFTLTLRADVGAGEWVEFDDAEFYRADGHLLVGTPGGARIEIDSAATYGIAGYNSSNLQQFGLRLSDGAGEFGAGSVLLNCSGMKLGVPIGLDSKTAIKWGSDDYAAAAGYITVFGGAAGGESYMVLQADNALNEQQVMLQADTGGSAAWLKVTKGPGGSTINLATNNTSRLFIANDGKVGISNTAPTTLLEVGDGAENTQSWMQILASNSAANSASLVTMSGSKALYLYNNGTTLKLDAYDYNASAPLNVTIGGNGGDVIITNADLLVGTTSPIANFLANINGKLQCSGISVNRTSADANYAADFNCWVKSQGYIWAVGGFQVGASSTTGASGTITVITAIQDYKVGSNHTLQYKSRNVGFSLGIVTSIGAESGWQTFSTFTE